MGYGDYNQSDPRKMWFLYYIGTEAVPMLYVGISKEPMERFFRHMETFGDLGETLTLTVLGEVYTRKEAEVKEKGIHEKYPRTRTLREARNWLTQVRNGQQGKGRE